VRRGRATRARPWFGPPQPHQSQIRNPLLPGPSVARRGIEPRWITPVVEAVDRHLPEFQDAFDDHAAWGPAKEIAAALAERGVDLTDKQAVEEAIHALNAERLLGRLTD
jgi:hypothetical protein